MRDYPSRVVVVGSAGRLGAAVVRRLLSGPRPFRVIAYDRKAMDLAVPPKIEDHLCPVHFDALVNCAALTSVDECERQPDLAHQTNAAAVGQMAAICREKKARMIHVSTDYVYDGTRPGVRTEADPIQTLGVYARTKREGEERVLAAAPENVVARMSWIFGPDRPAFPDQILRQAKRGEALEAIDDKFSTPSYSADLACMIEVLLRCPDLSGVLNLCNSGSCSWKQYAQEAVDIASQIGWLRTRPTVAGVPLAGRTDFLAQRPANTAMSPQRFSEATGMAIRSWQDALRAYIQACYSAPGGL